MSLDVSLVGKGGCVFAANITHNLGYMADKAGIYKHCWRPEEIGIQRAGDLIEPLSEAINDMENRPEYYKKFDSPNGWGLYDNFLPWLEDYLTACKENPGATIEVDR